MNDSRMLITIGILGGTGKEGRGLAYRWAKAGYRVLVGSRDEERAKVTALDISNRLDGRVCIEGTTNTTAAQDADVVVLAVPYAAHRETLASVKEHLPGKILLDVAVPLAPPQVTRVQMPPAGSAAQEARQILGENIEVVSAFQNISHTQLLTDDQVDCDVLVCGTSRRARLEVLKLVEAAGLTGWDAGPLENSMVVEGLTSILLGINKLHGSTRAGIRITGVKTGDAPGPTAPSA